MPQNSMSRFKRDLKWGLGLGWRMAAIYGVAGLVVAMGAGAPDNEVGWMLLGYGSAGLGGGFILGLFRPLARRSRLLAMLVGIVVAAPAAAIVGVVLHAIGPGQYDVQPEVQDTVLIVSVVLTAVLLGGFGGWFFGPGGPGHTATD